MPDLYNYTRLYQPRSKVKRQRIRLIVMVVLFLLVAGVTLHMTGVM